MTLAELKNIVDNTSDRTRLVISGVAKNLTQNELIAFLNYANEKLPNLETLSLSGNGFTQIPEEIAQFKQLKSLDLYNNNLKELPKSLSRIQSLTSIKISNNNFEKLPPEIIPLEQLERIDISNNPNIKTLPGDFLEKLEANAETLKLKHTGTAKEINEQLYAYNNKKALNTLSRTLLDYCDTEEIEQILEQLEVLAPNLYQSEDDTYRTHAQVLNEFLEKIHIGEGDIAELRKTAVKNILETFIQEDNPIAKQTELSALAFQLGNCDTPTEKYLEGKFFNLYANNKDALKPYMLKMAVEEKIANQFGNKLNDFEKIEKIKALAYSVLCNETENNPSNKLNITGARDMGFTPDSLNTSGYSYCMKGELNKVLKPVAKLFCKKNKFGFLKTSNGAYIIDNAKLDKVLNDFFIKNDRPDLINKDARTIKKEEYSARVENDMNLKIADLETKHDVSLFAAENLALEQKVNKRYEALKANLKSHFAKTKTTDVDISYDQFIAQETKAFETYAKQIVKSENKNTQNNRKFASMTKIPMRMVSKAKIGRKRKPNRSKSPSFGS